MVRGVAQPGSAPVLGTGGRKFESSRPDHQHQFDWTVGRHTICAALCRFLAFYTLDLALTDSC